jgi:hypothetical protein
VNAFFCLLMWVAMFFFGVMAGVIAERQGWVK